MATLEIGPSGNPVVEDDSDKVYGAAGTNPFNLSQGALAALGGSGNVQAAVELATALSSPEEKGINSDLAALLYFTKMGELASKPGATLLGSAAGAATAPAAYLMQESKAERDRKAKIGPLAVQLATTLGKQGSVKKTAFTNTKSKAIEYYTPKEFAALSPDKVANLIPFTKETDAKAKTSSRGGLATYFATNQEAEDYFKGLGLAKDNPNFKRLVETLTTPDSERVGQTYVGPGGLAMELLPTYLGNQITNFNLSPVPGTQSAEYASKLKRLNQLQKEKTTVLGKGFNVIPSINTALSVLMSGVQTGGLTQATLGVRNKLGETFGLDTKEVEGQQMLESISNKLAPGMRPVGSGSTSDMEFNAFKSAVLTMSNTPFANYMSLWTLKRVTENSAEATALEEELLASPKNYSQKYINEQIEKVDTGLYSKFKTKGEDGEPLYANEDEKTAAATEFWKSLPRGDVFYNIGEDGETIFTKDAGKRDVFLIKGFPRMQGAN